MPEREPVLRVEDLRVGFTTDRSLLGRGRVTEAVRGVGLEIHHGTTHGLVGESGSGKTTAGRAILGLIPPATARVAGRLWVQGEPVSLAPGSHWKKLRRKMQIVFQDPAGSLNPRMRVWASVSEPLSIHDHLSRKELRRTAESLLQRCGMPASASDRYPHEFSGGQRQRIAIARALALGPEFLVLDEPTSALDVSVQAQILNLLRDLQKDLGLTTLLISHDMGVIAHMCDRISVMRRGEIVESGARDEILFEAQAGYTNELLHAVPGRG